MTDISQRDSSRNTYPDSPGWKGQETSREAALAVAPKAKTVRERVYSVIANSIGPISADQVATKLDYPAMWIRPRVSELAAQGKIEPATARAKNESGMTARMWRVAS